MELNRNVCALKTSLCHIEKTLGCTLETLSSKNREALQHIEEITSDLRLKSFFEDKNDDQLRKLHFLLFLNSSLSVATNLEGDCSVGHVIGSIPRLSTSLYFALAYEFKLFKYFNEMIEMGPVMIAIELLDITNTEVKILSRADRFKVIVAALIALTTRLMKTDCKYSLKKFSEHFYMLMLYYKAGDEEKIQYADERSIHEGYKFLSLVCLLRMMTRLCYGEIWDTETIPLYSVVIPFDKKAWYSEFELKDKAVVVNECYEFVLLKCRDIMCDLDLDMFLTWHEIVIDGKTLQNTIGEEVFYLCRILDEKRNIYPLPSKTNELIMMLQSVVVKPAVLELITEKPNAAYLELSIIEKNIFDNVFLSSVDDFLADSHFNPNIALQFIRKLFDGNSYSIGDQALVKKIIVRLLPEYSSGDLAMLLNEFIKRHGMNHFLIEQDVDFCPLIKQINVLYSRDDADNEPQEEEYVRDKEKQLLKQAALLAFHSTCAALKGIIREGCSEKTSPMVIIKILGMLAPICSYQHVSESKTVLPGLFNAIKVFLQDNFEQLSPVEKDKCTDLMIGLNARRLIQEDVFLSHCLLPLLYVEKDTNWLLLADLLKLFKEFYFKLECKSTLSVSVIMAQLAQILEESRWSLTEFSMKRVAVCEIVSDTIEQLARAYLSSSIKISSTVWLQNRIKPFSVLTKSYFSKICTPTESNTIESKLTDLIHKPLPISPEEFYNDFSKEEDSYVLYLGKLLAVCTHNELSRIVENYGHHDYKRTCFIFNMISDAIAFIANAASQLSVLDSRGSESIFHCLGYLINGFLDVLQKTNVTCRLIGDEVTYVKYINRVISTLKVFPKHLLHTYQFNVIKFVTEELPKLRKASHDFDGDARQLLVGLYLL